MTTINGNLGDSGTPTRTRPAPGAYPPRTVEARNRGGAPETNFNTVSSRIDMVLRIGLSARPQHRTHHADSPLGRAVKLHDAFIVQLREFAFTAREVLDSGKYTPIGLKEKMVAIGAEYLSRVESLNAAPTMRPFVVRTRDRAEAEIADALKSPNTGPVDRADAAEVRAYLYTLGPSERGEAWSKIVSTRDPVGLAAVLNAPKIRPVFDDRTIAEGVKVVVEATNPLAVKTRDAASEALFSIDEMTRDVRSMIGNASGIPIGIPREGLSAADAGGAA